MRLRMWMAGLAVLVALAGTPSGGWAIDEIPVRIGVIRSGGQADVTYVIRQFGIDRKYGLAVQQVDLSAPGQQYVMLRGDTIDASPGTFVDLMRQRKAGIGLQAFHGRQRYNNLIVTRPDSAVRNFSDLKGKRVGNYGTTFLDWLIVRAAGRQAFGVDLEKDAVAIPGSPPLLNQFLARGEVDGVLQFSTLTVAPVLRGEQRPVIDMPSLIRAAGFNPEVFNSHWLVSEKWVKAHPDGISKLSAVIDEAYARLRSEGGVWPAIAREIGMTDPAMIAAYRDLARKTDDAPYDRSLMAATQQMLDAIIAIAGDGPVGFTRIDPNAFLFAAGSRR
jgi:ABC-type nitrate/sulfonate/bicarbonate transport system substrate-binding protein